MITEAEIQTIDFNSNSCVVRIPLFESVNTLNNVILDANIAIQPGIINGYKPGDIVWIAFENGLPENPIVIGKVYKTVAEESKDGSAITCQTFNATKSATVPLNTLISGAEQEFDTLTKIVSSLKSIYTFLGIDPASKSIIKSSGRYFTLIKDNSDQTKYIKFTSNNTYASVADFVSAIFKAGFTSANSYFPVNGQLNNNIINGIFADTYNLNDTVYCSGQLKAICGSIIVDFPVTEDTIISCQDISGI